MLSIEEKRYARKAARRATNTAFLGLRLRQFSAFAVSKRTKNKSTPFVNVHEPIRQKRLRTGLSAPRSKHTGGRPRFDISSSPLGEWKNLKADISDFMLSAGWPVYFFFIYLRCFNLVFIWNELFGLKIGDFALGGLNHSRFECGSLQWKPRWQLLMF